MSDRQDKPYRFYQPIGKVSTNNMDYIRSISDEKTLQCIRWFERHGFQIIKD